MRPSPRGNLRCPPARAPPSAAPTQPLPGLALSTEADPGVHDSRSPGPRRRSPPASSPKSRLLGEQRGFARDKRRQESQPARAGLEAEFQDAKRDRGCISGSSPLLDGLQLLSTPPEAHSALNSSSKGWGLREPGGAVGRLQGTHTSRPKPPRVLKSPEQQKSVQDYLS